MKKKVVGLTLISFAFVSALAFAAEWKGHPHLHKAHQAIDNAMKALKQADDKKKTEFGGHRAKAEELLTQAQHEIEAAVDYANNPANK
jgi:hypothetical protein